MQCEVGGGVDIQVRPGGFLTLLFMWLGCKVFSHIVSFSIPQQLAAGNMAVGLMIMGIFIGIGTAMGLVIGLGLN